jgi:hypothetical protein
MAVSSGQTVVGLTPIGIDGVSTNPYRLHLHNGDNTKNLFIGNATVSSTTGLKLMGNDHFEMIVSPNEQLFVVSEQGDHTISWLRMDV